MLETIMDAVRCDAELLLRAYFTAANLPEWKTSAVRDIVSAGLCHQCGGDNAERAGIEQLIQLLQRRLESLIVGALDPSTSTSDVNSVVEASGPWAQAT